MLIQRGSNSESINLDKPDIFYNYFTLGLVGYAWMFLLFLDHLASLKECLFMRANFKES